VRELFFPEGILVVLELKFRKKLVYTIGKNFEKVFSQLTDLPR